MALILTIGNVNYIQNSNEKSSNLLEVETEEKSIEQIEIKSSGDNDFSTLWISGDIGAVEAISIGDQDDDGKGEIIVGANQYIKVFEYNATYNNYTNVYTSEWIGSPYAVCVGDDLDQDGKKEIIGGHFSANYFNVREYNGNDNDYDIVYNSGLGGSSFLEDICIGNDLDKDGRMEIVIGDGLYLNVSEYNGVDNGYTNVWTSNSIGMIQDVCTDNDLDEDGKAEIIAVASKTYVFENTGANAFTEVWSTSNNGYHACVGNDLDNDGKKEIVVSAFNESAIIYEYNGTDNGYDQVWNSSGIVSNVLTICVGNDLDRDGKNEIITGSSDGKVTIIEYNGTDNGYSKIWDSGTTINKYVENIAVSDDLNNDGKKELIATTNDYSPNRLYIFQHDDTISPTIIIVDDDDDDDDDEEGIYISTTTLIVGGTISAIAIVAVIILLIKRKR